MTVYVLSLLAAVPTGDPTARYGLSWTRSLPWGRAVNIADVPGESLETRVATAQKRLGKNGVVYFPAGVYRFRDTVKIADGVIWRGADPENVTDARKAGYAPPTRFVFPRYEPKFTGGGEPTGTAFKGIHLEDPATASRCGVVNIAIENGHIEFGDGDGRRAGRDRLVVGCVLRNAATADPAVPDRRLKQKPWQRFTARHHAAITVKSSANALVANNRLPKSGEANFTMNGYVVRGRGREREPVTLPEVVFDYDNRPGIYVNDYAVGAGGGNPPDGTPETHPHGFRKGLAIRDNFVYGTGRCAISFTGDGTLCRGNVIRFAEDVYRPTTTGRNLTSGSSTNDNRAVQMRGWRWRVIDNDYVVHRNLASDRKYYINDGEGLMHEDHVNSTVKDSRLVNNRGNRYISIYKTGGIDGLLIRGNDIRTAGGLAAIYVVADRNSGRHACRNVRIEGNTTAGGGIRLAGSPSAGNVIRDNKHVGRGGVIALDAAAELKDNRNYRTGKK